MAARDLTRFKFSPLFTGRHLFHFFANKMEDFRNFVLHNCILNSDAKQVYLQLQVTNLKR